MAGTTRLELATSAVTGQRSNQLNYVPNRESSNEKSPGEGGVTQSLSRRNISLTAVPAKAPMLKLFL
jgi:hypothetical protein